MWRRSRTVQLDGMEMARARAHARCEQQRPTLSSGPQAITPRHPLPVRSIMTRFRWSQLTLATMIGSATALPGQTWPAGSVGFDKAIYAKFYIGVGMRSRLPIPFKACACCSSPPPMTPYVSLPTGGCSLGLRPARCVSAAHARLGE